MRAIPQRGVGIAAALAVLAVLAAPKLIQLRRPSTPASSATSKTILRVKVHRTVPTLLVERLATTGTVRANEEVEIVSEISGKISGILFQEGSRVAAGELLRRTLAVGGTILTFGNGGSAADAQHLAAEISGFYRGASGAGRAIALTADSALLTALANDAGYQEAIALQVGLHARAGDAVVAFSTSGRSENIVRGLTVAREKGLPTILVTGAAAPAEVAADVRVAVPSTDTQRIQEVHGVVVHLLCGLARGEG